jgi:predicted metal-dependent hydrolase
VPPRTGEEKREALIEAWYREQLKEAVPPLLARWQQLLGVSVQRFFVQRMKTRWGSRNPRTGAICLNTDLARKPRRCLEDLVVHEMDSSD